jgi:hypothetical protein
MKNRTAEEILSHTFAHLDMVVREKRNEHGKTHDRFDTLREQEYPAGPDNVAGSNEHGYSP